ncbi:MAG: ethanolamine utilization protein EutJ [bacterium]
MTPQADSSINENELVEANEILEKVRELQQSDDVNPPVPDRPIIGIDLGTSNLQLTVVDENGRPVASRFQWDDSVRDGIVLDYVAARDRLRMMLDNLREDLGEDENLNRASVGYPPGTEPRAQANVAKDVGLDVIQKIDEPTAAMETLGIDQGAIVDIGGGTTGISVVQNGEVVHTHDEPTGGHHITLVLAGNRELEFEQAEQYKRDNPLRQYQGAVEPVIQKMASIVDNQLRNYSGVETVYLVGGTCIPEGFGQAIQQELGCNVLKPVDPILVTPVGIALAGIED